MTSKSSYAYVGVAIALTVLFLAIEAWEIVLKGPLLGEAEIRGNTFGFILLWWLAIMVDILLFNRRLRVVEGRSAGNAARTASIIAVIVGLGMVCLASIPWPPNYLNGSDAFNWTVIPLLFAFGFAGTAVFGAVMALLPRHPTWNLLAGVAWTIVYFLALVFGVGMMMFCC